MKHPEPQVMYLEIHRLKTGVPDDQTRRTWGGGYEILEGYLRKIYERSCGNIKPPQTLQWRQNPRGELRPARIISRRSSLLG